MVALLALVCSLTAAFGTLTLVSADEEVIPVVKQCTVGDLPYFTWNSNYAGQDLGRIKVKLMYTDDVTTTADGKTIPAYFDSTKENYNLKDFTAKINDNALSLEGFTVENWTYAFPATGGSVVAVVESKIDGTIKWDYTGVTAGGWIDYNSLYRVYKKEAATGTVTKLAEAYHNADLCVSEINKGISVAVKNGDIVYYEFGADTGRNIQNFQNAKIVAQMEGLSDEITEEARASYITKLETKVGALEESRYTAENWAKIQADRFENNVIRGFQIITPKPAQILNKDTVDPPQFHILHQAVKIRTLKICP